MHAGEYLQLSDRRVHFSWPSFQSLEKLYVYNASRLVVFLGQKERRNLNEILIFFHGVRQQVLMILSLWKN
jgi:hypothetical protein